MTGKERFIGVDSARAKIGSLALSVARGSGPVVLTRRGKALAVLVSLTDYDQIKRRKAT